MVNVQALDARKVVLAWALMSLVTTMGSAALAMDELSVDSLSVPDPLEVLLA